MTKKVILVDEKDNVCTSVSEIKKNDQFKIVKNNTEVWAKAIEDVSFGHKIAINNILKGDSIIKYGQIIGRAKKDINKGEWVHIHNVCDTYKSI